MKCKTTLTTCSFTKVGALTMQPILKIEYWLQKFALYTLVFVTTGCSTNSELVATLEYLVLGECIFLETFSVDEMAEYYQASHYADSTALRCHLEHNDKWIAAKGIVWQRRYNEEATHWIKYLPSPCHTLKKLREKYRRLNPEQPPDWPTELSETRCA